MNWTYKDTVDLLVMIAGALAGTVLLLVVLGALGILPIVGSLGITLVALNALAAGLTLRFVVWKRGYRQQF